VKRLFQTISGWNASSDLHAPAAEQHCNPIRVESNWEIKVLDKKFPIILLSSIKMLCLQKI